MNNKQFLDAVHGYISVPEDICDELIDTCYFQRLRRIEQTSSRSLFPYQEQLLDAYKKMEESIDNAPESPTPFPVVKNEKLSVIGDANETQVNKHDFTIVFRLPEGVADGEKVPGGVLKEVEYKDVFVAPRQSGKVISALCRMLPFFRKIIDTADGGKEGVSFTRDEVVEMLAEFGDDFVDDILDHCVW